MREYKVGEQIILEVAKPEGTCQRCYFWNTPMYGTCYMMCDGYHRKDGKNVIFVEKGK